MYLLGLEKAERANIKAILLYKVKNIYMEG
jgi:hypothetical protein